MSFFLDPPGFVFETWCDWIIAYPITAEAILWLSLISEALWPDRDHIYVNYGRVVPKSEWYEFMLEVYKAGWGYSFAGFHEKKCHSVLAASWDERSDPSNRNS